MMASSLLRREGAVITSAQLPRDSSPISLHLILHWSYILKAVFPVPILFLYLSDLIPDPLLFPDRLSPESRSCSTPPDLHLDLQRSRPHLLGRSFPLLSCYSLSFKSDAPVSLSSSTTHPPLQLTTVLSAQLSPPYLRSHLSLLFPMDPLPSGKALLHAQTNPPPPFLLTETVSPPIGHCLLARVLGPRPTAQSFLSAMTAAWKLEAGLECLHHSNGHFIFKFSSADDLEKATDLSPWHLNGNAIVIKQVSISDQPSTVSLSEIDLTVRVYDLPLGARSTINLEGIAASMNAMFLSTDVNELPSCRNFVRFRFRLDVKHSLAAAISLARTSGEIITVKLRYEKLPVHYYFCARFGHTFLLCSEWRATGGRSAILPFADNILSTDKSTARFFPKSNKSRRPSSTNHRLTAAPASSSAPPSGVPARHTLALKDATSVTNPLNLTQLLEQINALVAALPSSTVTPNGTIQCQDLRDAVFNASKTLLILDKDSNNTLLPVTESPPKELPSTMPSVHLDAAGPSILGRGPRPQTPALNSTPNVAGSPIVTAGHFSPLGPLKSDQFSPIRLFSISEPTTPEAGSIVSSPPVPASQSSSNCSVLVGPSAQDASVFKAGPLQALTKSGKARTKARVLSVGTSAVVLHGPRKARNPSAQQPPSYNPNSKYGQCSSATATMPNHAAAIPATDTVSLPDKNSPPAIGGSADQGIQIPIIFSKSTNLTPYAYTEPLKEKNNSIIGELLRRDDLKCPLADVTDPDPDSEIGDDSPLTKKLKSFSKEDLARAISPYSYIDNQTKKFHH